jgi:hypothetical protein
MNFISAAGILSLSFAFIVYCLLMKVVLFNSYMFLDFYGLNIASVMHSAFEIEVLSPVFFFSM